MRELLVVCLLCCLGRTLSAPGRSADEVLIGEVDIATHNDNNGDSEGLQINEGADDDDSPEVITEETLSKKCIIDTKIYAHNQRVPSSNLNSHCLCIAGKMYCWWQAYSTYQASISSKSLPPAPKKPNADVWITGEGDYSDVKGLRERSFEEASEEFLGEKQQRDDSSEEDRIQGDNESSLEEPTNKVLSPQTGVNLTVTLTTTTTEAPTTCLVMGRSYREGDVLPYSTGNCVECSCGSEGRIECSPRDCVGLRPQIPGANELDLFELERDSRGLDDAF